MRTLLPLSILSFIGVAAAAAAGCSGGIVFPTTAIAGTITGVPSSCSGQVYLVVQASDCGFAKCSESTAFALCDGTSYTECDCSNPGSAWSVCSGSDCTVVGTDGGGTSSGDGGGTSGGDSGGTSAGDSGGTSAGDSGGTSGGDGGGTSGGDGGGTSGGDGGSAGASGGG